MILYLVFRIRTQRPPAKMRKTAPAPLVVPAKKRRKTVPAPLAVPDQRPTASADCENVETVFPENFHGGKIAFVILNT